MSQISWQRSGRVGLHRRDLQRDLDLVGEQRSARIERLIPDQAEISAVELAVQLELDPIAARLARCLAETPGELDLPCDATHRELAHDIQPPCTAIVDARRAEADLRVALDVEEVERAAQ